MCHFFKQYIINELSAQCIGKVWPKISGELKSNLDFRLKHKIMSSTPFCKLWFRLIFNLYLKRRVIFSQNETKVNPACVQKCNIKTSQVFLLNFSHTFSLLLPPSKPLNFIIQKKLVDRIKRRPEVIPLQYWELSYVLLDTIFSPTANPCPTFTQGVRLWLEAFVKASQQV